MRELLDQMSCYSGFESKDSNGILDKESECTTRTVTKMMAAAVGPDWIPEDEAPDSSAG